MKKQAVNPYLPSWEYIPDGEPHLFDGRVYIFGSHDAFNGSIYCPNDYVCWSAPEDDLGDWRYEGVIYEKTDDPFNADGHMALYAPDVTVGADGRYYLYYVLDKVNVVSVAVCDSPAGRYRFYGYVHYADGVKLGDREGDQPQFDPAVITEGDRTYLYTGFCGEGDMSRKGAMVAVLGPDMLTVIEDPVLVVPGNCYGKGTCFENREFFEGPSIRKFGDTYYFAYSCVTMHELCYATSKHPTRDFVYRGVLVSNCDMNIGGYKPPEMRSYYRGNNHGGLVELDGRLCVFFHRHTNGTSFSRQGCAEVLEVSADGTIKQAVLTSQGLNGKPLIGRGVYPAHIACNLFSKSEVCDFPTHKEHPMDGRFPRISQDGRDGDEERGYVAFMSDSAIAGYKYFDCKGVTGIAIKTRGYGNGRFEVKLAWDGETLGTIPVSYSNVWTENAADIAIPDGVHSIYFEYKGQGSIALGQFEFKTSP